MYVFVCSDTVSRELERKREKINQHSDRIQSLKSSVNSLKEEKLDIEKELQERKQLEERKEELEEKNDALAVEIQVQNKCSRMWSSRRFINLSRLMLLNYCDKGHSLLAK